jgi:2-dehydro-3-deoxyphosphogalactonate aldolase
MIREHLARLPFVAILRGITPEQAVPVGCALVAEGFGIIEVPLNSPRAMESINLLSRELGDTTLVGAGTVTTPGQVDEVARAGGRLIVMPHGDAAVLGAARAAGLCCMPGVATPTEGFAALANGADALKLFPAEQLGPPVLKAWRAVFPPRTLLLPVGGIRPDNLGGFLAAGADGFGLGSALYQPGSGAAEVGARARASAKPGAGRQPEPLDQMTMPEAVATGRRRGETAPSLWQADVIPGEGRDPFLKCRAHGIAEYGGSAVVDPGLRRDDGMAARRLCGAGWR